MKMDNYKQSTSRVTIKVGNVYRSAVCKLRRRKNENACLFMHCLK